MPNGIPPSALDTDNLDKYPRGPNGLARLYEDRIAELEAAKKLCRTREERRPINQSLHQLRDLVRWMKSRAGYFETPADLAPLDAEVALD